METVTSYDFKGNPLIKQRKVIADSEILSAFSGPPTNWDVPTYRVDWTGKDETSSILDSFVYQTDMEYDALDRVTKMVYPQDQDSKRKVYHPTYNKAGNLQSVDMEDDQGSGNFTNYVKELAYDAKGQRLLIAFGNGLMTRYTYDSRNFRLERLKNEKYAYSYDSTNNTHTYSPQSGTTFQDYAYDYDLVGNILHLTDKTPISKKGPGDLTKDYLYDPLYRLLSATGRECDKPMKKPPWEDQVPYCHDPTATRNYTREYTYDKMGNITKLHHVYGNSSYNRDFAYIGSKNLLDKITMGSTDYQFSFDSKGNQVQENSSRFFEWDHSDQLRAFYIQASSGSEPSVYTHYLYDGEGNRIKKLTRKDSGKVEVTVYIDDVFEESYIKPSGSSIDSNHHWNTLHVMDASSRVATIRAGTDNNDSTPAIKYNLEDHLGSSSVMVDDTGTLVNREEYYPFGDTSFGGFAKKRYRYTGKEKDEESGLYYYGARYYAPWTCRFISVDPEAGKNMNKSSYNYTSNNPLNRIDPTGGNDKPKDGGGDNGGGSKSSGNGGKGKNEKGGSNQSGGETPDVVNLKENQTLWDLAQKYEDVTVEKIKRLNEDIPEKHAVDNIPVGEEIQLKEKPKQSNQGKSTQNKEGSWFVNEKTGSILFIKGKEKMSERQKEKYGDNWNRLKVGKEFSKNVDIPDRIEQGSSYKLGPDSAKDLMEKYGYRKAYKVEILKIEREQTRFESDSPLTQSWSKERISDKEITYVKPEEFGIINSYIYDRKFDSHSGIRTTERVVNKYVAYSEEGPQTDINNWSDSWKGILKGIIELLN